jgi:hypothetical protein
MKEGKVCKQGVHHVKGGPPSGLLTMHMTTMRKLHAGKKMSITMVPFVGTCRIVRIEGILRVIGADASDPDRVRRAEASIAKLKAQLAELQAGEGTLSEQVQSLRKLLGGTNNAVMGCHLPCAACMPCSLA